MQKKFGIAAATALLAAPVAAQAQGIPGGMERVREKVTPLAARQWGRGRCAWWRSRRRRQLFRRRSTLNLLRLCASERPFLLYLCRARSTWDNLAREGSSHRISWWRRSWRNSSSCLRVVLRRRGDNSSKSLAALATD
jgi:hypothetical protein